MRYHYRTIIAAAIVAACLPSPARATDIATSVLAGYNGGMGFGLSASASQFAFGFPLAVEFTVSHASMDPGDAELARRVFINDATNGTPEKSGGAWNMQLDFLHRVPMLDLKEAYIYGGVHHSQFTGNFRFVGGNEDFNVSSDQWGIAGGVKAAFPMSKRLNLVVKTGLEYFFASTLYGHDTSYSPDNLNVNAKHDYTYRDADLIINQPKFQLTGLLGFSYTL